MTMDAIIAFDDNLTTSPLSMGKNVALNSTLEIFDLWQGSALRHMMILTGYKRGRAGFNTTLEYVQYWDEYLDNYYTNMIEDGELVKEEPVQAAYPIDMNVWGSVMKWTLYVFEIPGALLLSGFGIASNIVVIIVFSHLGIMSDSCTVILTGIGISDLIYCFLTFVAYVMRIAMEVEYRTKNATTHTYLDTLVTIFVTFLNKPTRVFIQFNCLTTSYLALERMVSVMFPFSVKRLFNPRRSWFVMAAIFVVCILGHFHSLFGIKIVWIENQNGQKEMKDIGPAWATMETENIEEIINSIILRPTTIVLIAVFNAVLLIKVAVSKRFKKSTTSKHELDTIKAHDVIIESTTTMNKHVSTTNKRRRERTLTRMTLAVSLMFFVCYSPKTISALLLIVKTDDIHHGARISVSFALERYLTVLELANSCFNVVIYYTLSSRFNQGLRHVCVGCKCKKRE